MTGKDIIKQVKALALPKDSYIVFGSGPMAAADIRQASDIDLLVSEEVFKHLRDTGWQEINKGKNDNPLAKDAYEAHKSWNFSSYKPTLVHLLATATEIEDIPFASLYEVRKWKISSGRPKDLEDIKLIDDYFLVNKTSL